MWTSIYKHVVIIVIKVNIDRKDIFILLAFIGDVATGFASDSLFSSRNYFELVNILRGFSCILISAPLMVWY